MARSPKNIGIGQLLGIIVICTIVGVGLGCLYTVHPLLMVAGISLICIFFALIKLYRTGSASVPVFVVLCIVFIATTGLGLYFGTTNPSVSFTKVINDERVIAAIQASNSDSPSDGKVSSGPYIVLRWKDTADDYVIAYSSERQTQRFFDNLQTVIIVPDYETIDSAQYILKQWGKQVGDPVTGYQYRLKVKYYDIQKKEIVRTDTIDGDPLTKDGGGGLIPDSVVLKEIKATMKETDG